MEQRIKYLMLSFYAEMVIGTLTALFMALFIGVMATDSPKSKEAHFSMGSAFGFSIVAVPLVLLPWLAALELKKFPQTKRIVFTYIKVLVTVFTFFPLGIWQVYMLIKLESEKHLLP